MASDSVDDGGGSARIARAAVAPGAVALTWEDETTSTFHHAWLRDHCPQSVHPVSNQREVALSTVPPDLAPASVTVEERSGGRQALCVRWPASADPTGAEHVSSFDGEWLRGNCYSRTASTAARARDESPSGAGVRLWGGAGAGFGDLLRVPVAWADIERGGADGEGVLRLLEMLHETGVGLVSGVPASMEATEQLARTLAPVHETLYGGMWDVGTREESEVIDTAYSSVELPLHTDGTYLTQQPGLQLFNCVAQPPPRPGRPLDGATRLVDGLALAAKLAAEAPEAFGFFCRAALPFEHTDDGTGTHLRHVGPVFQLHPLSGEAVGVRWNETDRGAINTLSFDDVGAFYAHARTLQAALDALETSIRLQPGEAIITDNHRVMHGRHAFVGQRRLLGCYLHADDWRSRWRVLRAAAGGKVPVTMRRGV